MDKTKQELDQIAEDYDIAKASFIYEAKRYLETFSPLSNELEEDNLARALVILDEQSEAPLKTGELRARLYGLNQEYEDMPIKHKLMFQFLLIQCLEHPAEWAEEILNNLLDEATDDPVYHGFQRSDAQEFIVKYADALEIKEIFEDKPWIDPAGGIHDPDETDPAKQYE